MCESAATDMTTHIFSNALLLLGGARDWIWNLLHASHWAIAFPQADLNFPSLMFLTHSPLLINHHFQWSTHCNPTLHVSFEFLPHCAVLLKICLSVTNSLHLWPRERRKKLVRQNWHTCATIYFVTDMIYFIAWCFKNVWTIILLEIWLERTLPLF